MKALLAHFFVALVLAGLAVTATEPALGEIADIEKADYYWDGGTIVLKLKLAGGEPQTVINPASPEVLPTNDFFVLDATQTRQKLTQADLERLRAAVQKKLTTLSAKEEDAAPNGRPLRVTILTLQAAERKLQRLTK